VHRRIRWPAWGSQRWEKRLFPQQGHSACFSPFFFSAQSAISSGNQHGKPDENEELQVADNSYEQLVQNEWEIIGFPVKSCCLQLCKVCGNPVESWRNSSGRPVEKRISEDAGRGGISLHAPVVYAANSGFQSADHKI
jgi:hypothetical protein